MDQVQSTTFSSVLLGNDLALPLAHYKYQQSISILDLPYELIYKIFYYLTLNELVKVQLVSKEWKIIATDEVLLNALPLPKGAFGKKAWEKYFGKIGEEPCLSFSLHRLLEQPCPFWKDKKIKETHQLILLPKTVDDQPLNLISLGTLIKNLKEGHCPSYKISDLFIFHRIMDFYGEISVTHSYWILMTRDIIPEEAYVHQDTTSSHQWQKIFVEDIANKVNRPYKIVSLLEATIGIFATYLQSQECLFPYKSKTYTRCQENIFNHPIVVGGFDINGLSITMDCSYKTGIAVLCKVT